MSLSSCERQNLWLQSDLSFKGVLVQYRDDNHHNYNLSSSSWLPNFSEQQYCLTLMKGKRLLTKKTPSSTPSPLLDSQEKTCLRRFVLLPICLKYEIPWSDGGIEISNVHCIYNRVMEDLMNWTTVSVSFRCRIIAQFLSDRELTPLINFLYGTYSLLSRSTSFYLFPTEITNLESFYSLPRK